MIKSFKRFKESKPDLNNQELIKLTLSTRPGRPAAELLKDMDNPEFWVEIAKENFARVVFILIRIEYLEYMRGTLDEESTKTVSIFEQVVAEEIKKAGL